MKLILNTLSVLVLLTVSFITHAQKRTHFRSKIVYTSDSLIITQLAENSFEHTSYLQTNDFGKVPCNGLIVRSGSEVIVFDTPSNNKESEALINWIKTTLNCTIKAIVPTHFHNDCLGGLAEFHKNNIPSYAYFKTCSLAKENGYTVPQNEFTDSIVLKVGSNDVIVKFLGEGHTRDNVVGYFAEDKILFGGCLIKEKGASKGYLGDANVADWSATVDKIKNHYPNVELVVPGHGEFGNRKLLDYTIKLFKNQ